MPSSARSPAEESQRLHRARRAAERAERDAALSAADVELQKCRTEMGECLLMLVRWRPQEALTRIAGAISAVERARLVLRNFFDNAGKGNDDGR